MYHDISEAWKGMWKLPLMLQLTN